MWEKATRFRFSRAPNRQTGDDSMLEWWRIDTNTIVCSTAVWKHTNARTGNHNWTLIEHGTSFLSVPLAHWRTTSPWWGVRLSVFVPSTGTKRITHAESENELNNIDIGRSCRTSIPLTMMTMNDSNDNDEQQLPGKKVYWIQFGFYFFLPFVPLWP